MDQRQKQQQQGTHANEFQQRNCYNDSAPPFSNISSHLHHYHNVQQQYHQHFPQGEDSQPSMMEHQHNQQQANSYQYQPQQHHQSFQQQQSPSSQVQYARKPSIRTNTSSSTTYSTISSMTSASSSVASPTAFSPSWASQSHASPLSNADKDNEQTFMKSVPYSPEQSTQVILAGHHNVHSRPVIEPSVSQKQSQPKTIRDGNNDLNVSNFDMSGTSNSSSDTVSDIKPLTQAQEAGPAGSNDHLERSTSSSSSSSSQLSSAFADGKPYETPLTAALVQNEQVAKQKTSLNEPGYPFPAVSGVTQQQKEGSKLANHTSEDPWKHTDDLLAPSGKSVSKQSAGARSASTLSLSKPAQPASTAGQQHVSTSQTTTPTAVDMDRRDSQSSYASSRSGDQPKSTSTNTGNAASISLSLGCTSSSNLAKLSSSSSPATSGGMTGFSPLSPLVQPFSPSANATTLPGKLGAIPKSVSSQSTTTRGAKNQPGNGQTVLQTQSQEPQPQQYRQATDRNQLDISTTSSSSGDTGYFSGYTPAGPYGPVQPGPSSAVQIDTQQQAYTYGLPLERSREAEAERQRSWSEDETLAMHSAPVQGNAHYVMSNLPPSVLQTQWAQSQQAMREHIEPSLNSGGPPHPSTYAYGDQMYGRHPGQYGSTESAVNASFYSRGGPSALRSMPVGRSSEGFDAGLYGYGPPSISDVSTAGNEEICTIFVVGFPEDIQEREFQNMFLFARGFEAATLKIPASTAAARERDAAAAAAVSAIAATLPAFSVPPPPPALDPKHGYGSGMVSSGGSSYDHLNNSLYEETFHAATIANGSGSGPHGHIDNAQRVSSALAAAALTATASTASLANTTNKKQIIGFAKFRSKDDAMIARDLLSGRKIDPEKGCVLKAEMAKKNLHVKRSGTEVQGSSLPPLAIESNLPLQREGASALDKLAERERQREWHARMATAATGQPYDIRHEYQNETEYDHQGHVPEAKNEPAGRESNWPDATYDAFHSVPSEATISASTDQRYPLPSAAISSGPSLQTTGDRSSAMQASAAGVAARQRVVTGTSNFGKSLLQEIDDQEDASFPLPDPTPGFGASAYSTAPGEQSSRRQPPPAALPSRSPSIPLGSLGGHVYLNEDYRKLSLNGQQDGDGFLLPLSARDPSTARRSHHEHVYNNLHVPNSTTPTSATISLGAAARRFDSPDAVSPTFTEFRQPRTQNRADDNTPISTLYVGGLPSSLPGVAGSVSASQLEDALRNVFGRCPGFRRMSYRHKSQGPMCFIEFEDTQHATRALNEIYGHTLGGLVKGGIRLAYSKNPLGVRVSGSSGPDSPTPLSPGYFASDAYNQSSYYGSPTSVAPHAQASTPTLSTHPAHYNPAQGFPQHLGDYSSPPASQQAFHMNQQGYSHPQGIFNHISDQRHALDRRATSPQSGPASNFSPFALRR